MCTNLACVLLSACVCVCVCVCVPTSTDVCKDATGNTLPVEPQHFRFLFQNEAVPILASFLRKNHRALRLSTLLCLDILIRNYGRHMPPDLYSVVLRELPARISEGDLHVSQVRPRVR